MSNMKLTRLKQMCKIKISTNARPLVNKSSEIFVISHYDESKISDNLGDLQTLSLVVSITQNSGFDNAFIQTFSEYISS